MSYGDVTPPKLHGLLGAGVPPQGPMVCLWQNRKNNQAKRKFSRAERISFALFAAWHSGYRIIKKIEGFDHSLILPQCYPLLPLGMMDQIWPLQLRMQ